MKVLAGMVWFKRACFLNFFRDSYFLILFLLMEMMK